MSFAFQSVGFLWSARDGRRWVCPMVGCRSSVAHGCLFSRHSTQQVHQRRARATVRIKAPPPLRGVSRPPEIVAEDAVAEVQRLEAAITVLGELNPHARPLKDALQTAKSRSRVPPVVERVEACKTFLERAKRRVLRAEDQEGRRTTSTWRRSRTPSGGCCS